MTVTYTEDAIRNTSAEAETFVPRYARAKRARKGVRTWMILAPIGALALIGGGAAMLMGGTESQPLVEPEPVAPAVQPLVAAPLESSVSPSALTTPAAVPAPVVREAPPAPPPAVQRRATPAERRVAPATVAPRVETAPEPTGPQAYSASPSEVTVQSPLTPAPTSAPRAPAIQTAPLN
jgi:hypothetical protein